MKKAKLKSNALAQSQKIKAECERKRTALHKAFGDWVTKNSIGFRNVVIPDFNFDKHKREFTLVSVGFNVYLVQDSKLPKKFHSVIALYKDRNSFSGMRFVPEIGKLNIGQTSAREFTTRTVHTSEAVR